MENERQLKVMKDLVLTMRYCPVCAQEMLIEPSTGSKKCPESHVEIVWVWHGGVDPSLEIVQPGSSDGSTDTLPYRTRFEVM